MNAEQVGVIRKNLSGKTTEELCAIYEAGDGGQWKPEAIEAVRQLLEERQVRTEPVPADHGDEINIEWPDKMEVTVRDFNMPFGSLVMFMVKVVLAAIPALIILFFIGLMFWMAAGAMLVALFS